MFEKYMRHKESGQNKNSIVRERCGCKFSVLEGSERNALNRFGHGEIMGEERLGRRMYRANVEGSNGQTETT